MHSRTLGSVIAVALLLVPAGVAHAASIGLPAENSEFVTIDRPVREVAIEPGTRVTEIVTVKNQTSRAVDVTVAANDLAVRTDGSRSPKFASAGSQPRQCRWPRST